MTAERQKRVAVLLEVNILAAAQTDLDASSASRRRVCLDLDHGPPSLVDKSGPITDISTQ
jgi:hypothetical protein